MVNCICCYQVYHLILQIKVQTTGCSIQNLTSKFPNPLLLIKKRILNVMQLRFAV